jgi:dihydrofolate reductase
VATTVYYCAASLDGFIADADDGLEWLTGYEGAFEGEGSGPGPMADGAEGGYDSFYASVTGLVMGSVTYRWVLDHLDLAGNGEWPYRGKPCWVLSSRDLPALDDEEADVRVVDGSVKELFPRMAASAGDGVLWVLGGGGIASQFADQGLLDEVHLTVVPVVLGAGKPLFERGLPTPMRLLSTRAFDNGMVEMRCAPGRS